MSNLLETLDEIFHTPNLSYYNQSLNEFCPLPPDLLNSDVARSSREGFFRLSPEFEPMASVSSHASKG